MLKIILLLTLLIVPIIIGIEMKGDIVKRRQQLESVVVMINEISLQIRYNNTPLPEIISHFKNDERFSSLEIPDYNSVLDFADAVISNSSCRLKPNESSTFKDFFIALGSTDTDGQINHCGYYKSKFTDFLCNTKENDIKLCKVYPSLGAFFGIFLLIMFI